MNKPRCFGHYKDNSKSCKACEIYYECYTALMTTLINDPEAIRVTLK